MKAKHLILILIVLLLVILLTLSVVSIAVYESVFGQRHETRYYMKYSVDEIDGLGCETCRFKTRGGHFLAGYHYSFEGVAPRGVLILAHGLGGGGHVNYLDYIAYFARNGYAVFSYDVTGNDRSEGKSVQGLPRGGIDLDHAISYVKNEARYDGLPIVLLGHSWGGHSVGAVLNRQTGISAVVSLAGFDTSLDMILQQGGEMVGGAVKLLAPFVSAYEAVKFGPYAGLSALEGFKSSSARIMILHSDDDTTVRAENGYDKYEKALSGDPRVTLRLMEGRGHNDLLYDESVGDYKAEVNAAYKQYLQDKGVEPSAEVHEEFMTAHLDKDRLYALDEALMAEILTFYNESIGEEA